MPPVILPVLTAKQIAKIAVTVVVIFCAGIAVYAWDHKYRTYGLVGGG